MLKRETVEKVSRLARLELSESEVVSFGEQLSAVLANFEQIAKVDTAGVAPLVTPTDMTLHLRPDVADTVDRGEAILANATEKSGRLFKVPPVV